MNEELSSNKIENEKFKLNNSEDDFNILITKLKDIGSTITLLENNIAIN